MSRFRTAHLPVAALALLVAAALPLAAGCGRQAHRQGGTTTELPPKTITALQPQPPSLWGAGNAVELHDIEALEGVRTLAVTPLTTTTARIALRLLVITATEQEPALAAWQALLDQHGAHYDVLVASVEPLEASRLVLADDIGAYQGILLTTNNLSYFDGSAYVSAFSNDEWELLSNYARTYGIRQVALYAYPGTVPESYGIEIAGPGGPAAAGYAVTVTAAGRNVFPYLEDDVAIPVRGAWVYPSRLSAASDAVPILVDADGHVLGVLSTSGDGRERLALTFDQAAYGGVPLLHTQLLGRGLLRWVTRGLFVGEQRYHFGADIDDWFIPTGLWDVDAPIAEKIVDEGFELSPRDAWSFALQQGALRSDYPAIPDAFRFVMAFNGVGATNTLLNCDPDDVSNTLSGMTRCLSADFGWLNHTWSHEYMDRTPPYYDISYAAIDEQIARNDDIAVAFGFGTRYAARSLVTGDLSGLGWHAPGGPDSGPKVDFGLEASNPDLIAAAKDRGRDYVASNMSVPSHEPDCAACGIPHPFDASVLLVPRWPTNLFFPITTPAAAVQSYNLVYGPSGSSPYFDRDLEYDEYLDVESDIALAHVLSGSPYPHYFHVANIHEYAPSRSVLHDWTAALVRKVDAYLTLPLRALDWDALGAYAAERTSFAALAASGVWDRAAGSATLTASSSGTLFLTGASLPGGVDTRYGEDLISQLDLRAGQSVVVNVGSVDLPDPPVLHTLTVSIDGNGVGLVLSSPSGIACSAGRCSALFVEGSVVTLVPVPLYASTFTGWSGACSATAGCSVVLDGEHTVRATFEAQR